MQAGTLEIVMAANMARLADDMAKSKAIVGGAMKDMETAVASLKSALGALGVGLGVGYFVSLIRGSIDAAEHLADLSKTTNIAVETLSGLKIAAKQSGGDLDSIAKSINKLSVEMGQSPEKFRALGVSAKDPLEAFKQLADIFTKLEDPQQRAAVMAAALGKSWAGAAPLLSEGGQKIGEMVERGSKFAGVTADMARQADELNDKLVLLVGSGGLLTRTIGPLLPLLNTLADNMLKATEKSRDLNESFSPLLEMLKVVIVLGANVSFIFDTMGKDIARAIENVQLIAQGDFAGSRALGELFRKDAAEARAALDAYSRTIMGIGTARARGADGGAMDMGGSGGIFGRAGAADAAKKAAAFLASQSQASELKQFTSALQALEKQIFAVNREGAESAVIYETTKGSLNGLTAAHKAALVVKARELDALKLEVELRQSVALSAELELARLDANDRAKFDRLKLLLSMREQGTEELENEAHAAKLAQLNVFTDQELALIGGRQALIEQAEREHQQRVMDIRRKNLTEGRELMSVGYRAQAATVFSELANMTAGVAQYSRTLFEINKVAGIATIALKIPEAIASSYAFGAKFGGPPLGAAMAAVAGLAMFAQMAAIQQTKFGGGGVGSAPSIAASTPATPVSPVSAAESAPSKPAELRLVISGQGAAGRLIAEDIAKQLLDIKRDGGFPALFEAQVA